MATFTIKVQELNDDPHWVWPLTQLDYPIFDEAYRDHLNNKIIAHYWNYEIGQETDELFRHALRRKMNEIMPLHNQLYTSQLLVFDELTKGTIKAGFDPLINNNLTDNVTTHDEGTRTAHSSTVQNTTADNKARAVSQETPQVMLSPNEDYATGATNTVSEGTTDATGTNDDTGSDTHDGTVSRILKGIQGVAAPELLNLYRSSMMNIDMMVIDDLQTLFMQVWDNGDSLLRQGNGYGYDYGIGRITLF